MTQNSKISVDLINTEHPEKFILNLQPLLETIVNTFISSKRLNYHDKEDLIQTLNEKLLEKIPLLKTQFNGQSSFKTYLSVIIINMCKYEIKKNSKHVKSDEIDNVQISINETSVLKNLVIQQERERYFNVLKLYPRQKEKIIFLLKIISRIPLSLEDFIEYDSEADKKKCAEIVQILNSKHSILNEEIYPLIYKIINRKENRDTSPDAIRKWISNKINEIIELMNGEDNERYYNKESFMILIEKIYLR